MSGLLDSDGVKHLTTSLKSYMASRLSATHPVGTVVTSDVAIDPAALYGGTWEQIPEGYYLKSTAADVGQQTSRSTTLTVANLPAHTHTVRDTYISSTTRTDSWSSGTATDSGTKTVTTSSYGRSSPTPITWTPAAHNTYIYVRTA